MMKNTELIKIPNVRKYMKNVENKMNLTKEIYTVQEAADYFFCTKSQIKGYHNNYKDLFGNSIIVEGNAGKQKTMITKEGMFLLALLLCEKSVIAKDIATIVEYEYSHEEKEEEQISFIDTVMKEFAIKQAEKILEEAKDDLVKIKSAKNKDEELIRIMEKSIQVCEESLRLVKEGDVLKGVNLLENFLETYDTKLSYRITTKDGEIFVERGDTSEDNETEATKTYESVKCNCKECEKEDELEEVLDDDTIPTIRINIIEEEVDHEEDEINRLIFERSKDAINFKMNNAIENEFIKSYMEKCILLGIEEEEAAIMIQNCIVNEDPEEMDSIILDYLLNRKSQERNRKRSVLKEWINLLAKEKFDGKYAEAYHVIANEMRYAIGCISKGNSYLDGIIDKDGFETAIEIISSILAE